MRRVDVGQEQCGGIAPGDRRAVLEPLVTDRRSAERDDREDRAGARSDRERLGLPRDRHVAEGVKRIFQRGVSHGGQVREHEQGCDPGRNLRRRRNRVGRSRRFLRSDDRRPTELVIQCGRAAGGDERGVARVADRDEFGDGGVEPHRLVAPADAERHVRRVIAHETQHIQVAGSGDTGSGVQTSEERPGRQHAVRIIEQRGGGRCAIFHEILGRANNRSDDIRQAAAIVEDIRVVGGRRPLAHQQPVGGERVGDLVKIGVVERTVARGEVGGELRPRESTGRKLGFERRELHRVRRRGRDIGRRLQDERRVVEQRMIGPHRDI